MLFSRLITHLPKDSPRENYAYFSSFSHPGSSQVHLTLIIVVTVFCIQDFRFRFPAPRPDIRADVFVVLFSPCYKILGLFHKMYINHDRFLPCFSHSKQPQQYRAIYMDHEDARYAVPLPTSFMRPNNDHVILPMMHNSWLAGHTQLYFWIRELQSVQPKLLTHWALPKLKHVSCYGVLLTRVCLPNHEGIF